MSGEPIQVVLVTNVLVSASRSKRGASFKLLSMLGDRRFEANVSVALFLEYEEKLKAEHAGRGESYLLLVDLFLSYFLARSNRRSIFMGLHADGIHADDAFVFDLAVASRASHIVTYNRRHFAGAAEFGIRAIEPGAFLRMLERNDDLSANNATR